MARKIRVTETIVYEYEPDFGADVYKENEIETIEEALNFDHNDYDEGNVELSEIAAYSNKNAKWEIIDEPTQEEHKPRNGHSD